MLHNYTFMVFSVTYTICKGPKLDVYRSSSVTSIDCQHDIICWDWYLFEVQKYLHLTFHVPHWGVSVVIFYPILHYMKILLSIQVTHVMWLH